MAETASLTQIKDFFGYERAAEFTQDWKKLTSEDQQQLRQSIGDGSFTY